MRCKNIAMRWDLGDEEAISDMMLSSMRIGDDN